MSRATLTAGTDILEAILLRDQSLDGVRKALNQAIRAQYQTDQQMYMDCYVCELFLPQTVVYSVDGEMYRADYTIDLSGGDPVATLGTATPVEVGYVDSTESTTEALTPFIGDLVPLVERAMQADGTIPIKLIDAGWGSSGYYSKEVLQRDGPRIWPAGTHQFFDHPSLSEARDRPERSVRDLASVTATDAEWRDDPVHGPGLYALAKPLDEESARVIEAIAPYTGLSIRAAGYSKPGEAEGRKGPIITSLERGDSVDYVTVPGRGGKVLQLMESARKGPSAPPKTEVRTMPEPIPTPVPDGTTLEQFGAMQEANRQMQEDIRRMRERETLREGQDLVTRAIARWPFHEMTRQRLTERLVAHLPLTADGAIDTAALTTLVTEAAQDEARYVAQVGGAGQVRGVGPSADPEELTEAKADEQLDTALATLWGAPAKGRG